MILRARSDFSQFLTHSIARFIHFDFAVTQVEVTMAPVALYNF
jgi:hypothetical protein